MRHAAATGPFKGLSSHSIAEARSEGTVSASKPAHGVTEICEKGNMAASTAAHVQPGTNVTLSCQLKQLTYSQQCKTALFFNGSELISNYGTSVSSTFPVNAYGKHMFTCKIDCEYKKKLICGIDIESGSKESFTIPHSF